MAGASLLFTAPAQAYDIPTFEVPNASQAPVPFVERATDAAGVVELWKTGGPATRAAAATALAGGADALRAFLDAGQDVTLAADRKQLVTELTTRGSAHVRSSAQKILALNDPAAIDAFLTTGWAGAWQLDLDITAYRFLTLNGAIRTQASTSLDKGPEAIEEFVLRGWLAAAEIDDRQAAFKLFDSPVAGVRAAAKAAVITDDREIVADFLRYGQLVAAGRDAESATVSGLLQQVKSDIAASPNGTPAVADRAKTAVEQARMAAAAARTADSSRLAADRDLLSSLAISRRTEDEAQQASQEPAKVAFAKAAREIPELLTRLNAPGADLDALINEARQAALNLALVGTPEVRKAAEAAVVGGDVAVKEFITAGHHAASESDSEAFVGDRQRSFQLMAIGGEYVEKAAKAALKSANHADVRYFLEYGFDQARNLDNRIQTSYALDSTPEVRAAASVALDGSRADLEAFMTKGRAEAANRDAATTAHVASIDAMIAELLGLADTAAVDAGKAADAAKAAEAARQAEAAAEAARQAEAAAAADGQAGQSAAGQVDISQHSGTGVAPVVIPWPRDYGPAVGLAETGTPAEAASTPTATPSAVPSISVPPAASAEKDSASVDSQSQEAATPLAASSAGLSGWTIGLIVALVLAAAGAITFLLRRKGAASA